jgi:hypothetical protein
MKTHFVTLEINLKASSIALQHAIELELQKQGEPLRWAVTEVDTKAQKAFVEAIVTTQHD